MLYGKRTLVGGFGGTGYWTSSQYPPQQASAWGQYFLTAYQEGWAKTSPANMRPVRAF